VNKIVKVILLSIAVWSLGLYAEEVKIMPLGDSITYGNNYEDNVDPRPTGVREAYRSHLYYKLQDISYNANFVGSQIAGDRVSPPFDPDNEGHAGWSSYRLADHAYGYLLTNPADIVLLHAGTNDHADSVHGVENILNEIDYFEVQNRQLVTVVLALIIDRREHDKTISSFNSNLRKLANERIRKGDAIILVDMEHDAKLNSKDYADHTHPNSNGYNKMANVWFKALADLGGKPADSETLRDYPYTVVEKNYIKSIYVNVDNNSVTFSTEVPSTGIQF
jgi:lysophospholipase L1-like esterase